jgi:hypothetical protein
VEEAVQQAKHSYEQYREKQEPAVIVAWGSLSYIGEIR